jgi:hypothetical protein
MAFDSVARSVVQSDLFATSVTVQSAMTDFVGTVGGIKPLFQAASVPVTLVVNKFSFKYDEDLPGPILIVIMIAEFYFLSLIPDAAHRQIFLTLLISGLVCSSIVFMLVYRFLSYQKRVDALPPRWKFWKPRYDKVRTVGGFWLRPDAKARVEAEKITVAEYFAGVAYDEDMVWWRWSRACSWLTLVVSYFFLIFCAVGSLFVVVESLR